MDKKHLLYFAVYVLIVVGISSYFSKQREKAQPQQRPLTTETQPQPTRPSQEEPDRESVPTATSAEVAQATEEATQPVVVSDVVSGPEQTVRITSDLYDILLDTRGGRVLSWRLLQYAEMPPYDPRLLQLQISQLESRLAPLSQRFPEEMALEEARTRLGDRDLAYYKSYLFQKGSLAALKEKLADANKFQQAQDIKERPLPQKFAVELVPQKGQTIPGTFYLEQDGRPFDLNMVYETSATDLIVNTTETLVLTVQDGNRRIEKTFTFYPDRYTCDFDISFTFFTGEGEVQRGQYELVMADSLGRYIDMGKSGRGRAGQSAIVGVSGKLKKEDQTSRKRDYHKVYTGSIGWFGMDNRYFIGAVVPDSVLGRVDIAARDMAGTADVIATLPLGHTAPGVAKDFSFRIYMGPKDTDLLKPLGGNVHQSVFAVGLLKLLRLSWICPLILNLLKLFYRIIPNYGVGILIVSVLVKWITYPLTIKQLRAMKKMQELAPQIKELKEKYKDNPKEMQKKTMELYSQHGANPMGSCLPLLLQMPVFIGLFMTLNYSIQLRGEPFIFWINDLSRPDALFYIPFQLPIFGFVSFNVIPLTMGLVTYLQQRKQMVDPQQAAMAKIMPVFFTILLWNFPSGVILYWTVSSLLQGVQQRLLNQPKHKG